MAQKMKPMTFEEKQRAAARKAKEVAAMIKMKQENEIKDLKAEVQKLKADKRVLARALLKEKAKREDAEQVAEEAEERAEEAEADAEEKKEKEGDEKGAKKKKDGDGDDDKDEDEVEPDCGE